MESLDRYLILCSFYYEMIEARVMLLLCLFDSIDLNFLQLASQFIELFRNHTSVRRRFLDRNSSRRFGSFAEVKPVPECFHP
jgi:small basic protein